MRLAGAPDVAASRSWSAAAKGPGAVGGRQVGKVAQARCHRPPAGLPGGLPLALDAPLASAQGYGRSGAQTLGGGPSQRTALLQPPTLLPSSFTHLSS
jgi:hypothetical protein